MRLLKIVQWSAATSRTQAINQLRTIVATAPDELRSKLRALKTPELVETCAAFRVRSDDDGLAAVMRLAMRELAQRIQLLDEQLAPPPAANTTVGTWGRSLSSGVDLATDIIKGPSCLTPDEVFGPIPLAARRRRTPTGCTADSSPCYRRRMTE